MSLALYRAEVFSDHTEIHVTPESADCGDLHDVTPEWLPDGFTLTKELRNSAGVEKTYNRGDEKIKVFLWEMEGAGISLDTEDAEIEYIDIDGQEAMVISKGINITVFWLTADNRMACSVAGDCVPKEDTLKVAENIRID